ncbi:hypothetical protein C8Q78DRAFT_297839 [Trametes maxima]|nr:hypothetical protein C8Q78DRAFT_297839 [Trametes maxima]
MARASEIQHACNTLRQARRRSPPRRYSIVSARIPPHPRRDPRESSAPCSGSTPGSAAQGAREECGRRAGTRPGSQRSRADRRPRRPHARRGALLLNAGSSCGTRCGVMHDWMPSETSVSSLPQTSAALGGSPAALRASSDMAVRAAAACGGRSSRAPTSISAEAPSGLTSAASFQSLPPRVAPLPEWRPSRSGGVLLWASGRLAKLREAGRGSRL